MTELWLPFAERRDGPSWKQGYPGVPHRSLSMIYGQVDHDAAGPWGALLGEIMNPTRQASWSVSVPETNRLSGGKLCVQHYPLEAITWHAGKRGAPAINNYDPSLLGNVTLFGIENADDGSGRLTDYQEMVWEEISRFLPTVCPNVAARPPAPRQTHWWHRWLSSTTCPNGRVDYARLMPRLEEDMQEIIVVGREGGGGLFTLEGQHLTGTRWKALQEIATKAGITTKIIKLPADHAFFKSGPIGYSHGDAT